MKTPLSPFPDKESKSETKSDFFFISIKEVKTVKANQSERHPRSLTCHRRALTSVHEA